MCLATRGIGKKQKTETLTQRPLHESVVHPAQTALRKGKLWWVFIPMVFPVLAQTIYIGSRRRKQEPPASVKGWLVTATGTVTGVEMATWTSREQKMPTALSACAVFGMKAEGKEDKLCLIFVVKDKAAGW